MISAILSCVIFSFTLFNDYESSFFQHMWLFYRGHARFVVFTVVLLKIQIFWDAMLCHWLYNTVLYPRRFQSSYINILNYVTTCKS